MDGAVFNDGSGFLSDLDGGKKTHISNGNFWNTVGFKCVVVVFVFWGRVARIGFNRDHCFVGSDCGNYTGVWESVEGGSVVAGSLSFLGELCLGFECGHFSTKQIILFFGTSWF